MLLALITFALLASQPPISQTPPFDAAAQAAAVASHSDPTAMRWLVENERRLQYPSDDFYAYRVGHVQSPFESDSVPIDHSFPGGTDYLCSGVTRVCVSGAVWSHDKRFIAFHAGDPAGWASPEILVARTGDALIWRASAPEEQQDVAWADRRWLAYQTNPVWSSDDAITFKRCAPDGRFDLIFDVCKDFAAVLPAWFESGTATPTNQMPSDVMAALSIFFEPRQSDGDQEAMRASVVVDDAGTTLIADFFGHAAQLMNATSLDPFEIAFADQHGLGALRHPYTVALGRARSVFVASAPFNVFEKSEIDEYDEVSRTTVKFTAWGWNPAAIVYDQQKDDIYAADPYSNLIYTAARKGKPKVLAGTCRSLGTGSTESRGPQLCSGGHADGPATVATFDQPEGLAVDAKDHVLYVADTASNEIRGIRASGEVFTLAGQCVLLADNPNCIGMYADGDAKTARFFYPTSIAFDSHDRCLYVTDELNDVVRRVTLAGDVTTIGKGRSEGDVDGAATDARFASPTAIAYDNADHSLIVLDAGNYRLRRIAADGEVSTIGPDLR
jgi:DNA-binding beta-propeller fold protein YncE